MTHYAERIFADHPVRLRLFRAICNHIERLGPVVIRDTDSQVSFRARRAFAVGAHEPRSEYWGGKNGAGLRTGSPMRMPASVIVNSRV